MKDLQTQFKDSQNEFHELIDIIQCTINDLNKLNYNEHGNAEKLRNQTLCVLNIELNEIKRVQQVEIDFMKKKGSNK